jgi:hypothetical protein
LFMVEKVTWKRGDDPFRGRRSETTHGKRLSCGQGGNSEFGHHTTRTDSGIVQAPRPEGYSIHEALISSC